MIVLIAAGIGYYMWQRNRAAAEGVRVPAPARVERPEPLPAPLPPPPPPTPTQRLEPPAPPAPKLPELDKSDRFMINALAALIHSKSLLRLFDPEQIISHIVSTIDNLPRRRLPTGALPVESPQGKFLVSGGGGDEGVESPDNIARYAPYVRLVQAVNPRQAAELYVRLYPLFQKAYESLGYPGRYFNDRLLEALDDLLAAPEVAAPIPLIRPKVFYLYADPDLEKRSAGQKILMRLGLANERLVKTRVLEFKQALSSYLHTVHPPIPSKQ